MKRSQLSSGSSSSSSSSRASTSTPSSSSSTSSSALPEHISRSTMASFIPLSPTSPSCSNSAASASPLTAPTRRDSSNGATSRTTSLAASSWAASLSKLLPAVLVATLCLGTTSVLGQEPNNITSLKGTWSTGSGAVSTGLGFFNPVNLTFNWPATAGRSYSFTDTGFWEEALYIYDSQPGKPNCVSAQLIWQHGTYVLNDNNTLSLTPFGADGRQSIANRCATTSTNNTYYYQEEYMTGFTIELASHYGQSAYALQLYAYDGSLMPLMWQTHNPPQMLPTTQLHETIYGQTA